MTGLATADAESEAIPFAVEHPGLVA